MEQKESYIPNDFIEEYNVPKDATDIKFVTTSKGIWMEWKNEEGKNIKYGYGEIE